MKLAIWLIQRGGDTLAIDGEIRDVEAVEALELLRAELDKGAMVLLTPDQTYTVGVPGGDRFLGYRLDNNELALTETMKRILEAGGHDFGEETKQ